MKYLNGLVRFFKGIGNAIKNFFRKLFRRKKTQEKQAKHSPVKDENFFKKKKARKTSYRSKRVNSGGKKRV